VAHLDIKPDSRILEIGGAPGASAELVCPGLTSGRMLVIDRSDTGAARIERRNQQHVAAGCLEIRNIALANLRRPAADRYDLAFAVNVNVFWTSAATVELAVLADVVEPGGTLLLAYTTPDPSNTDKRLDLVAAHVAAAGFTRVRHLVGGPASAIVAATPSAAPRSRTASPTR
jgi:hypothetical protein